MSNLLKRRIGNEIPRKRIGPVILGEFVSSLDNGVDPVDRDVLRFDIDSQRTPMPILCQTVPREHASVKSTAVCLGPTHCEDDQTGGGDRQGIAHASRRMNLAACTDFAENQHHQPAGDNRRKSGWSEAHNDK